MTRYLVSPDPDRRWLAIAARDVLLVVRAGPTIDASGLLDTLQGADPVRELLDSLTAAGLSSTPHFALVETGSAGTRIIARGDVAVTGIAGDVPLRIAGGGVATWVEELVADVGTIRVGTTARSSADDDLDTDATVLPLEVGAAWALAVTAWRTPAPTAPTGVPATTDVSPAPASADVAVPPVVAAPVVAAPAPPAPADTTASVPIPDVQPVPTDPIGDTDCRPGTDPESESEVDDGTIVLARRPTPAQVTARAAELRGAASEATITDLQDTRAPVETSSAGPQLGDHDGATVLKSDVDALRDADGPPAPAAGASTASAHDRVDYLLRVDTAGAASRAEPLDDIVLVGRAPTGKMIAGRMPHLVTIPGDPDLSRTHVELALQGDTVVVTDLGSRNGTSIVLPGKPPQALRSGEATPVIVGTVVDLGGGTTLTLEHGDPVERRD